MSKTWRYIKDYKMVRVHEVMEYNANGYELIGGTILAEDGSDWQTVVLYDDEVTLSPPTQTLKENP